MYKPLADRVRPETLDEVVGQKHLIGEGRILNRILSSGMVPNMIFYGPPGTGKTTVANIIAKATSRKFCKLNATNASVSDIKEIIQELGTLTALNGVLLYLDEIQNFNKKQQQSLLEFIENGKITLIASTTENPYFYVYNAILSRSTVFEFKPLTKDDIVEAVKRAASIAMKDLTDVQFLWDEGVFEYIAEMSGGDVRKAINAVELAVYATPPDANRKIHITMDIAQECTQKKILNYDRDGDNHYDLLSAFQKSIRGSDPDAAIYYLGRLVRSGDLISICRRLLVIASEDVGLAYPQAISIVKSCVDAALQVGLPEARINLAEAVLLLATAPKSNSTVVAIDRALSDIDSKDTGEIPAHIRDAHYEGAERLGRGLTYLYPHDYEFHYVPQQYLPDNLKDAKYYYPGKNKSEEAIAKYWEDIKKRKPVKRE